MTEPLLVLRGVSKRFPTDQRRDGRKLEVHAVTDVDLSISRGEILALVGESGSGKTTLGRLVLRLIEPSAGSIWFDGTELVGLPSRSMQALRGHMQIIFQDPFSSLNPYMRIGEAIAEPIVIQKALRTVEIAARVDSLLDRVGLPLSAKDRFPHQFSGGQRQRIAIARALAPSPEFIIADEAVAALDVSIQAQILNLLAELREELGLTMLFISHDLGVVHHIADRVAVMYLGRIVEIGPARAVIARPAHPYTQALVASAPRLERQSEHRAPPLRGDPPSPLEPPRGCAFAARCTLAEDACQQAMPPLIEVGPSRASACIKAKAIVNMSEETVHAA